MKKCILVVYLMHKYIESFENLLAIYHFKMWTKVNKKIIPVLWWINEQCREGNCSRSTTWLRIYDPYLLERNLSLKMLIWSKPQMVDLEFYHCLSSFKIQFLSRRSTKGSRTFLFLAWSSEQACILYSLVHLKV